jgi:threonine/homoserine/homoserine lactone efflux protein
MSSLWAILTGSFVMALSGALMPGPLFAYTVARTAQTRKNGFLVGPIAIAGHAALEALVLLALVLGVTELLNSPVPIKIIGVLGGMLLAYMGIGLLREARLKDGDPIPAGSSLVGRLPPFFAGIILSMGNPYWWVWWAMAGSATLIGFGVTLQAWQGVLAFYIGHEAGDLAWYSAVSALTHFGRGILSRGFYRILLGTCGAALIVLAVFLGISPFLKF